MDLMCDMIKTSLQEKKKLKNDSIIISLLNLNSNARLSIIKESSVDIKAFGNKFNDLIEQGYIVDSGIPDKYSITAKYIWEQEKERLVEEGLLLDFLEKKIFLSNSRNKDLSEKNKVIVMFMIICRAVDPVCTLDLETNEERLALCEELLFKTYDMLSQLGVIKKLKRDNLFGKVGNMNRVVNMFRHIDDIPKSGVPLYALRNKLYYVDVAKDGFIDENKLKLILKKVLKREESLSFEEIDELIRQMRGLTNEYAIYVNDNLKSCYQGVAFDRKIETALEYLYD